jgi:hypothetical protein
MDGAMPTLSKLEEIACQTFGLSTAKGYERGALIGVWVQPSGGSEVFLEYRNGKWYVLHGKSFTDCGDPPVTNLRELQEHMIDANAD